MEQADFNGTKSRFVKGTKSRFVKWEQNAKLFLYLSCARLQQS